jgi:hypothetical protein
MRARVEGKILAAKESRHFVPWHSLFGRGSVSTVPGSAIGTALSLHASPLTPNFKKRSGVALSRPCCPRRYCVRVLYVLPVLLQRYLVEERLYWYMQQRRTGQKKGNHALSGTL